MDRAADGAVEVVDHGFGHAGALRVRPRARVEADPFAVSGRCNASVRSALIAAAMVTSSGLPTPLAKSAAAATRCAGVGLFARDERHLETEPRTTRARPRGTCPRPSGCGSRSSTPMPRTRCGSRSSVRSLFGPGQPTTEGGDAAGESATVLKRKPTARDLDVAGAQDRLDPMHHLSRPKGARRDR